MNNTIKTIDTRSKKFVTKMITGLFGDTAALSDSVIEKNLELMSKGGFSVEDRTIPVECVNFFVKNISIIYLGLISNDVFRDAFKDAVAVEISLDERSPEFVAEIRNDMKDSNYSFNNGKNIVVDLSSYNEKHAEKLGNMIGKSLRKIAEFESEFNDLVDELTEEEFITVGFCISNFAYLLRAIAKNQVFVCYIEDVLDVVKQELNICIN